MGDDGPERVRGDVERHVRPAAAAKRGRFTEIELGLKAPALCRIEISPRELDPGLRHAKRHRDHRANRGGDEQRHDAREDQPLGSTSPSRSQGTQPGRESHANTGTSTTSGTGRAMFEMTTADGRSIEGNMRNVPSERNSALSGIFNTSSGPVECGLLILATFVTKRRSWRPSDMRRSGRSGSSLPALVLALGIAVGGVAYGIPARSPIVGFSCASAIDSATEVTPPGCGP